MAAHRANGGTLYSTPKRDNDDKAIAFKTGLATVAVASALYTINLPVVATPTFSPVAGLHLGAERDLSSTTSGAIDQVHNRRQHTEQTVGDVYSTR